MISSKLVRTHQLLNKAKLSVCLDATTLERRKLSRNW